MMSKGNEKFHFVYIIVLPKAIFNYIEIFKYSGVSVSLDRHCIL